MVMTAFPFSCQPWNGVFRLLERKVSASTVNLFSKSMIVRSAGLPGFKPTCSSPRIRAGLIDMLVTRSFRLKNPISTNLRPKGKEVSSPINPLAAASNSRSFSTLLCGAWSDAMRSIVPLASPSRTASLSLAVRKGGWTLAFVS